MSFKVNDRVVYPHHGAAIIRKTMVVEFDGDKADYFEIEMVHDGLTVSVPVDKLEELGIRSPVSLDEVDEIMAMLTWSPRGRRAVRHQRDVGWQPLGFGHDRRAKWRRGRRAMQ